MKLRDWIPDALLVCGGGAISYGAGLVYGPAIFIVGGAFLMGFAWLLHKGK